MGAWGYAPKDNDGAWDLHGNINQVMDSAIEKEFGRKLHGRCQTSWKWNRIGVVQLLLEAGFTVPLAVAKQALREFDECLADEDWVASWRDPRLFIKTVRRFREALADLVDRYNLRKLPRKRKKGRLWVMAPKGWPKVSWNEPHMSWTGLGEKLSRYVRPCTAKGAHRPVEQRTRRKPLGRIRPNDSGTRAKRETSSG